MSSTLTNPSEIARETLRRLATKRVAPTPDNYRELYHEISGVPDEHGDAERALHSLALEGARAEGLPAGLAQRLDRAAKARDWTEVRTQLAEALRDKTAGKTGPAWPALIRNLLQQWDTRQQGLTPARKRESLERVLNGTADPILLGTRLTALVDSWTAAPPARNEARNDPRADSRIDTRLDIRDETAQAANGGKAGDSPSAEPASSAALRNLLADTLEAAAAPYAAVSPPLITDARALAKRVRMMRDSAEVAAVTGLLRNFWFRLELACGDNAELHEGVLRLLRLLIDNVGELVIDDKWLHGQIEVVRRAISSPASIRVLDDAERSLKEVIYKQSQLKLSLTEGKTRFKSMVTSFIDQLSRMAENTGSYQGRIEVCAKKLRETEDIGSLNGIVEEVLRETRTMQAETVRARDELLGSHKRALEAEQRIHELEIELERIGDQVSEDQLTGVLNRRGMDDAMQREAARANRRHAPLSVALLDIDNFKKLNDNHGHQAGDAALKHLAEVIRETMRPNDVVARYGGEEFLILLPDTEVDPAIEVMVRLQRELTRRFFLHDNERLLITFSCVVALLQPQETQEAVIARADAAMYQAKRAGKNRVLAAAAQAPEAAAAAPFSTAA
jgi:diguanylate cyclase